MTLHPRSIPEVPEETVRIARAAFPKGNRYLHMRDELGSLYEDQDFAGVFPQVGQQAESPWRLALVTVMQFAENLTDRQAVEAVAARVDWKYALSLEMSASSFDASVLCEFRTRLVNGGMEGVLLERMLERFAVLGLVKQGGKQRTDSTHVMAVVRDLNRLECVGETLRAALESLSIVDGEWVQQRVPNEWFMRYALPFENSRLPQEKKQREALAEIIGQDGFGLLTLLSEADTPLYLAHIPAVKVLRWVWIQQYYGPHERGWRSLKDLPPCAKAIHSPYDVDARYSCKNTTVWTGYKVHLTETCDVQHLHVITDVQTTSGTTNDQEMIPIIQSQLLQKQLLPAEHFVDSGYTTAEILVENQRNGIDLVGPVKQDPSWQRRAAEGYEASAFQIDWERRQAICPQGQSSQRWRDGHTAYGTALVRIQFAPAVCHACSVRSHCTRSHKQGRGLAIHPRETYEVVQAARQRQTESAFKQRYHKRAGVEGTVSQGVSAFGLRFARYRGLAKTHLQHLATAVAINIVRCFAWSAKQQHSQTRHSHLQKLALSHAC